MLATPVKVALQCVTKQKDLMTRMFPSGQQSNVLARKLVTDPLTERGLRKFFAFKPFQLLWNARQISLLDLAWVVA